jgi:Tetratricopeptide repeat
MLGEEHPDTRVSMNNLGQLYADQGKYAQAEPLYTDVLQIAAGERSACEFCL